MISFLWRSTPSDLELKTQAERHNTLRKGREVNYLTCVDKYVWGFIIVALRIVPSWTQFEILRKTAHCLEHLGNFHIFHVLRKICDFAAMEALNRNFLDDHLFRIGN